MRILTLRRVGKGGFTPKPLTEPYVILSHHTALHEENATEENHVPNAQIDLGTILRHSPTI
jgi:hypothetical protein